MNVVRRLYYSASEPSSVNFTLRYIVNDVI